MPNHVAHIRKLHERFNKAPSEVALELYAEVLLSFDNEVVYQICQSFAKNSRVMPTPGEMEKSCRDRQIFWEKQHPILSSELICRYGNLEESLLSRELCAEVTPQDRGASLANFGKVLCAWHYLCSQAKAFPQSSAMRMVRQTLKDRKLLKEIGEEAFFSTRLGFNPIGKEEVPGNIAQITQGRRQINQVT